MTETDRDPCAWAIASACLDLCHPCPRGLEPRDVQCSLRPQTGDPRRQGGAAHIEGPGDERRRPEVAGSVGVEAHVTCLALEACEDPTRVTQRIRVRADSKYTRVLRARVAQPTGRLDE